MIKKAFSLFGENFKDNFAKQLLLFAILIIAVFAAAIAVLPSALSEAAALTSYVETSSFYMGFILIMAVPDKIFITAVIMMICAIVVSPISCGASLYLAERPCKGSFKKSFGFAFKNYARLLGTYALYVIITLAVYGFFALFMYNFLHNMSHVVSETYLTPVMIVWTAGIIIVMGGLLVSPFCAVYNKKGGFKAVGASFAFLFKNFKHTCPSLLIGGVIWGVIAILPSYISLLFMAQGAPIQSIIYSLDAVAADGAFWAVMMISLAAATWFMFTYTHAVYKSITKR